MGFAIGLLMLGAGVAIAYLVAENGLGGLSGGSGSAPAGATDGAGSTSASTGTLSTNAKAQLTTDQQQFAAQLASQTGLSVNVISGWLLAEESGAAAQARQAANNNDWLNIGYTGAGTYGSTDDIWSNPITAADATAAWLHGQNSIPGYGTASQGIQNILSTAGQSVQAQISAIQGSGWAGSGYPDLAQLVSQVS